MSFEKVVVGMGVVGVVGVVVVQFLCVVVCVSFVCCCL